MGGSQTLTLDTGGQYRLTADTGQTGGGGGYLAFYLGVNTWNIEIDLLFLKVVSVIRFCPIQSSFWNEKQEDILVGIKYVIKHKIYNNVDIA